MNGRVIAEGLHFPEGPLFDHQGQLWCVELTAGAITRIDDGHLTRFEVGGKPNGLALSTSGDIWYCDAARHEIRVFSPIGGESLCMINAIDGQALEAPNDLAFDIAGNLVFTCPGSSRRAPTGYVACLTASGEVKRVAENMLFPNGLAFSADGAKLYIAETYAQCIRSGDWNPQIPGWNDRGALFSTPGPNGPDGLAIDKDGNIYAAIYGQGQICIADSAGACLPPLATDGQNPSNCAFDPSGRLGLVVTEVATGRLLSYPAPAGLRPFFGTCP